MSRQSEFVRALESGDVKLVQKASKILFPQMPQPVDVAAAESSMHMARTQMPEISFKARAYSHAWLVERGLPSQLPDELRPRAERLHPRIVEAVFISANTNSALLKPVAKLAQGAMCDAVEDIYADKTSPDPLLVRREIQRARDRTFKQLLGTTGAA